MKRTILACLAFALATVVATAQDYPSKPIRLIVPNPTGGATDAAARLYQQALDDIVPQPIVVVNMPGAGTTTGSRAVKDAQPDGHTMLLIHQALFTSSVMGLANYGPDAFEPIAMTGIEPTVLVVQASSPIKDLKGFYEAARKQPGALKAGVQIGALNHFAMAMVAEAGDVDLNYVQTGGGGPTYAALLGGHIDAAYASVPDATQYIQAGQMRPLAVLGDKRASSLPDVPTSAELGYEIDIPIRHVWYMPKGAPAEAVSYMQEALTKAINTDLVQKFYAARSVDPVIITGDKLKAAIDKEYAQFKKIEAGMKQ